MTFHVSGKIEFLCLFAIQDEVTGEKSSNLRGNYSLISFLYSNSLFETTLLVL